MKVEKKKDSEKESETKAITFNDVLDVVKLYAQYQFEEFKIFVANKLQGIIGGKKKNKDK